MIGYGKSVAENATRIEEIKSTQRNPDYALCRKTVSVSKNLNPLRGLVFCKV